MGGGGGWKRENFNRPRVSPHERPVLRDTMSELFLLLIVTLLSTAVGHPNDAILVSDGRLNSLWNWTRVMLLHRLHLSLALCPELPRVAWQVTCVHGIELDPRRTVGSRCESVPFLHSQSNKEEYDIFYCWRVVQTRSSAWLLWGEKKGIYQAMERDLRSEGGGGGGAVDCRLIRTM